MQCAQCAQLARRDTVGSVKAIQVSRISSRGKEGGSRRGGGNWWVSGVIRRDGEWVGVDGRRAIPTDRSLYRIR